LECRRPGPYSGQGDPVEAIRQSESRRFAAMVRADTAALRPMLEDELSYTHSNAMVETKSSHLAAIGSRRTAYLSLAPVSLSYRLVGEVAIGGPADPFPLREPVPFVFDPDPAPEPGPGHDPEKAAEVEGGLFPAGIEIVGLGADRLGEGHHVAG
jgi:hypothetical protein